MKKWILLTFVSFLLTLILGFPNTLVYSRIKHLIPNNIKIFDVSGTLIWGNVRFSASLPQIKTPVLQLQWYFCPWKSWNPLTVCLGITDSKNKAFMSVSVPNSIANMTIKNIDILYDLASLDDFEVPLGGMIKSGILDLHADFINFNAIGGNLLDWQGVASLNELELYPLPMNFKFSSDIVMNSRNKFSNSLTSELNKKLGIPESSNIKYPTLNLIGKSVNDSSLKVKAVVSLSPQREVSALAVFNSQKDSPINSTLSLFANKKSDVEYFWQQNTRY